MATLRRLPTGVVWQEDPRLPDLGDAYNVWRALYERGLGEGAAPSDCVISGGVAALVTVLAALTPEAGDDGEIQRIDLESVEDGETVKLSAAPGKTITFRAATAVTNDGEVNLFDGIDLVVDSPDEFVWLQRRGNAFWQIAPLARARMAKLYQDLDMGGFRAFGSGYKILSHAQASFPVDVGHRGKLLVNTVSCTYSLPLAQPVSGAQWQVGDVVYFRQEASSCLFRTSSGGTPRNLDNHDRGRGVGAKIEAELVRVTPSFLWSISGQTQAAAGGGSISRVYAYIESLLTIVTDAASTAWKNALALVHTPGSSEKWLYIAHAGCKSSGNSAASSAEFRFQRAAVATGPQFGTGRYAQDTESTLMMHAVAYGASPGSQTLNLDLKSGSASYSASMVAPKIFGIRLETDEYLQTAAGSANNLTNATYADLVTLTQTLPADDYYILAWATFDSVNQAGLVLTLDIDGGTLRQEKAMQRNMSLGGYYAVIQPWTFTAASHTIKLKGKSGGAWNSTVTDMGIVLLRKGRFQVAASANDATTTTTAAAAMQDKVTLSQALAGGWDHLVLGDADTTLDNDAAPAGVSAQLVMNATRIGQIARQNPRVPGNYVPVSAGFMGVVRQQQPTDAFAVQFASVNGADTATAKDASIIVLALAAP